MLTMGKIFIRGSLLQPDLDLLNISVQIVCFTFLADVGTELKCPFWTH